MGGAGLRLGRLFNRESGRSFVTAFDHGTNLRVSPEAGRPLEVVEKIVAGEPDGVLISPGMLKQAAHLFAFRGAPHPFCAPTGRCSTNAWRTSGSSTGSCAPRKRPPLWGRRR